MPEVGGGQMPSEPPRVVVVDDDDTVGPAIRDLLEPEGFAVEHPGDARAALPQLIREAPDLVILDINMPGMNGIDALRRIKEIKPDLKVILSSAYQEFKQDLASWASDEYIVKSSNLDELKAAVRRHLS